MKIKIILSMMAAAMFAAAVTGCYEKYDDPAEQVRYDDQWFTDAGYSYSSIAKVKELFTTSGKVVTNIFGETEVIGNNASVKDVSLNGKYYLVSERWYIKGKVTSNDAYGNYYRGLFIQDENGDGLEIKVGLNGMYTKYKMGETVYVICDGLALGNYRSTLSLGLIPMEEDHSDSNEPYANKYMEVQSIVDRHVFLGAKTSLDPSDITVVPAGTPLTDAQFEALCGKLVTFQGLKSEWTDGTDGYPQFLHKHGYNSYGVYSFIYAMEQWQAYRAGGSVGEPPVMPEPQNNYFEDPQPSWGFQEHQGENERNPAKNYGSALFTFTGYTGSGEIIIRTSGYSRFALSPVTPDGKHVDVTGIVARYVDKSGGNLAYQFTVNDVSDIVQTD